VHAHVHTHKCAYAYDENELSGRGVPQGTRELHKLLNLHRTVFVHLRFEFRTSTKAANFCKELISSEHSMLTWSFELDDVSVELHD